MEKLTLPESVAGKSPQFGSECWFDGASIVDMDYFVKTVAAMKAKGVSPELVGSIITHYASKWLPDLSGGEVSGRSVADSEDSPESVTALWMKKRFFVETLMGVLPHEEDSDINIPCNFLLRLLRTANMVGVDPPYRAELERRISRQLEQASLRELMIPSFSHTCGTLLDVELVRRLVGGFVGLDEAARSAAALCKVAKLVDCYLAEAAVDANLTVTEFIALATALPTHARALGDGLYRAVDTYLKAHPGVTKQERKTLSRVIDTGKLTAEACVHAAQNDRLPLRAVVQMLFSHQTKLTNHHHHHCLDWSSPSFSGHRSPNPSPSARCPSKLESTSTTPSETRKLREDVIRLQSQLTTLQLQMERLLLMETKKTKRRFFRWNRFGLLNGLKTDVSVAEDDDLVASREVGFGSLTPIDVIAGRTPKWKNKSMPSNSLK